MNSETARRRQLLLSLTSMICSSADSNPKFDVSQTRWVSKLWLNYLFSVSSDTIFSTGLSVAVCSALQSKILFTSMLLGVVLWLLLVVLKLG